MTHPQGRGPSKRSRRKAESGGQSAVAGKAGSGRPRVFSGECHRHHARERTNARTDAENGGQMVRRRGVSMVVAEGKSRGGSEL